MIIEIDKEAIPYQFDMDLAGEIYSFEINYNERFDFFTVDLSKNDVPLIYGEKIVYGKPLFSSYESADLPKMVILPIDESGKTVEAITWDNFSDTVILLVGELNE
jgi:hypothetical protein